MNINTTAQLQVILVKPEAFEDAQDIADNLISKRTVLLNIENLNIDLNTFFNFGEGISLFKKISNNLPVVLLNIK